MPAASLDTPIGRITVVERDGRIAALSWRGGGEDATTPLLRDALAQLRAYFARTRRGFDLPLAAAATPEAQAARDAMLAIPYGATASYGELAARTGSSPRAFGQACGANVLPIIVPCHRVIGSDGRFGFYSAGDGPKTKDWLLAHEGAALL
jgi:methylated-DNA-[protein]-cysteine S-methyltransferase